MQSFYILNCAFLEACTAARLLNLYSSLRANKNERLCIICRVVEHCVKEKRSGENSLRAVTLKQENKFKKTRK